ncbi:hypothetical protein NSQ89_11400 [Niallia sp. FSL R7-0648]
MIKLENVSFSYGNTPALRNVSIEETEPIIMVDLAIKKCKKRSLLL